MKKFLCFIAIIFCITAVNAQSSKPDTILIDTNDLYDTTVNGVKYFRFKKDPPQVTTPSPETITPTLVTGAYTLKVTDRRVYVNCSCVITLPVMKEGAEMILIRDGTGTPTFKAAAGVFKTGATTMSIKNGFVLVSYKNPTTVNVSTR